jgi:protein phosphatase
MVRRYLWVIGDWVKHYYQPDTMLEERYLFKQNQIVLDTKPALSPQAPEDFPPHITPYLKLFPYRLHIPQIYGYIPTPDERMDMNIWFLEYGTIPTNEAGELQYPDLLPQLEEVWAQASALRQLNWLWQIARLWQPLQSQGVVSSLLQANLLRVNNRIIQLLELKLDPNQVPDIRELAKVWSQWVDNAAPSIRDFFDQLCQNLEQGNITRSDQLIEILDQALLQVGNSQQRTYHILSDTNTGPTRDHNEDACYPLAGNIFHVSEPQLPLAIVCDGIGGQEGGEIASNLAIETLLKEVNQDESKGNPEVYRQRIQQAVLNTNDVICKRNDQENRQERQRMGTTLVMGLGYNHEMYITHVGDSRVYWITSNSCHQITVDDDLASREVRLGYLIYRDAVQYPNAGALVQALGMGGATALNPNIERFIVDEDCIFLLCSDGLSDYDRVDQFWATEIAPILSGNKNINEVVPQLITLANQRNGHDNVTIALIHCQVQPREGFTETNLSFPTLESSQSNLSKETLSEEEEEEKLSGETLIEDFDENDSTEEANNTPTVASFDDVKSLPSSQKSSRVSSPLMILFGIIGLLILGGLYWGFGKKIQFFNPAKTPNNSPTATITPTTSSSLPEEQLKQGDLIKVKDAVTLQKSGPEPSSSSEIKVPKDQVLKVLNIKDKSVFLGICSHKENNQTSTASSTVSQGWIDINELEKTELEDFTANKDDFTCPETQTIEPSSSKKESRTKPSNTGGSPSEN